MPDKEVIWIETTTGKRVNPLRMTPENICIEDIARPLSQLCRFVGQCSRLYTVGQHCIHVSDLVFEELIDRPATEVAYKTALAALLHDASEAYISDISRPVKHAVKGLKEIEDVLLGKVMQRFDCTGADWTLIKKMDNAMLATEAYYLMPSKGKGWYLPEPKIEQELPDLEPHTIYHLFMERFYKFGGK